LAKKAGRSTPTMRPRRRKRTPLAKKAGRSTPTMRPRRRKRTPLAKNAGRSPPIRVAIVGGGCAGITAAWHLSQQPGYEIHVYEKSWRLGGKGASVRDAKGRVLDHGLHVWLGFYENAFRMMRECYAVVEGKKWGPDSKTERLAHGSINDALFPEPHVGVASPDPHRDWAIWSGYLPPANGLPGELLDESTNPFTLANYVLRCFDLLKALMLSVIGPVEGDVPGEPRPERRSGSDQILNFDFSIDGTTSMELAIERMARLLRAGSLTGAAALLQAVTILEVWLKDLDFAPQVADSAVRLLEAIAAQTRKLLRDLVKIDPEIRMKTEIIDIVLTIAVGLFRDRVLFDDEGLDSINQFDYREWLLRHGATKQSVNSRFLSGIYDFAFAYSEGNKKRPSLAAGVALRGALRMFFTYRGSMFWRFRSGMGDAVFAPLYKVLRLSDREVKGEDGKWRPASPVQFHFLHELAKVGFDASNGRRFVSSLEFRTRGNFSALDRDSKKALDEFGCWPGGPDQFANAKGIRTRKRFVGTDFDGVIFAMGIDTFHKACVEAMPTKNSAWSNLHTEWAKTCAHIKTVATKSAQVWLKRDLESLGWYRGSGLITALSLSFDTWADMTHMLPTEAWRAEKRGPARSLAYFCAALPESEIEKLRMDVRKGLNGLAHQIVQAKGRARTRAVKPARDAIEETRNKLSGDIQPELDELAKDLASNPQDLLSADAKIKRIEAYLVEKKVKDRVEKDLERLLKEEMRLVWPAAFKNGSSAYAFIIDSHVQANFEGSDRYTLSEPGSIIFRISPLDRSVENMTVAGDWTACGLDVGCVEAAVMSGMLAARAISGKPDLEKIIGYDHP
jgi:uncharacterized protein with NAD-binding domain and iron-sulfur cluster